MADPKKAETAKVELVLVKFIAPYKNYVSGDICGFDKATSVQLFEKKLAVAYQEE